MFVGRQKILLNPRDLGVKRYNLRVREFGYVETLRYGTVPLHKRVPLYLHPQEFWG